MKRVERGIKVDRVRLDTDIGGERVEKGIKVDRVRLDTDVEVKG